MNDDEHDGNDREVWDTTHTAMSDQLILVQALHQVVCESEEAEVVRIAVGALTNSTVGLQYLSSHPIVGN